MAVPSTTVRPTSPNSPRRLHASPRPVAVPPREPKARRHPLLVTLQRWLDLNA